MEPVDHDANEGNPNMFIRWNLRDAPQPSAAWRDAQGSFSGWLRWPEWESLWRVIGQGEIFRGWSTDPHMMSSINSSNPTNPTVHPKTKTKTKKNNEQFQSLGVLKVGKYVAWLW